MITSQPTPLFWTHSSAKPFAILSSPYWPQGNTFSCWQYNGIHEQNNPKEYVDRHLKQHPENIMNSTIITICKPYYTICCLYERNCTAALSKITIFARGCQPHKTKKCIPRISAGKWSAVVVTCEHSFNQCLSIS